MAAELIIQLVKHLEDIEQSLPDNFRIAAILAAIGTAIIALGILAPIPPESGLEPVAPFFLGGLILLVGVFIFLRRAVWKLQDQCKPGIISLDLK